MKKTPGVSNLSLKQYRVKVSKPTHVLIRILHESISSWLPFQSASFVKQKVQLGYVSELGEDLEKTVSAAASDVCQMGD